MKMISLLLLMLFWVTSGSAEEVAKWRQMPLSFGGARIKSIVATGPDEQKFYIGTSKGVYATRRDGLLLTQAPQLSLQGDIHDLFIMEEPRTILAATEQGVLESFDDGKSWRTIYSGGRAFAVLHADGYTFIGTENGVYSKADKEEHFFRWPGLAGKEASYALRVSNGRVYSLGGEHLHLLLPESRIAEIIYSVSGSEGIHEALEDGQEREDGGRELRAIEILEGRIYIATLCGIFFSQNDGKNWHEVSADGLDMSTVNDLVVAGPSPDQGTLCAATDKGLYCSINHLWSRVDEGLSGERVLFLLRSASQDLFAATEKGLYVLPQASAQALAALGHRSTTGNCRFKDYTAIAQDFANEPSINEVHAMAVRYSDTDKKKIESWHRQSRARALIPQVAIGVDRETGELWHWDTGPNPDVLQKGREHHDWDLTVAWELSDLIWSSDQTSIDSRSKLMTELRNEILDQITRVYFERRRLQIELAACDYPSAGEKMAADLRVHELTALIDAYTGGEFSSRLSHRSNS